MQWENLYYALTQLVHNFGALAVAGGALAGLKANNDNLQLQRKFAWLVLGGWGTQAASGLTFGAISLYLYGETPDLHLIAQAALIIKVACAVTGILLVSFYLRRASHWSVRRRRNAWAILAGLGILALSAAAFLRWFA